MIVSSLVRSANGVPGANAQHLVVVGQGPGTVTSPNKRQMEAKTVHLCGRLHVATKVTSPALLPTVGNTRAGLNESVWRSSSTSNETHGEENGRWQGPHVVKRRAVRSSCNQAT